MFSKIGVTELLIILAIALLIFGPKALPKLGKSIGRTIGNFKKGHQEAVDEDEEEVVEEAPKKKKKSTATVEKVAVEEEEEA